MHRMTFYPLGNADCCRIDLENGKKLLFDYANMRNPYDKDDKRIDLPGELRKDLEAAGRQGYDVVAFTHLDKDHYCGASEFFNLEHATKYQGDDRIRIEEMWVPAAVITEKGHTGEAAVIQEEARHRMREGTGIRVFSRPERLKDWLEEQGIELEDRRDLITDAGKLIPGFTREAGGLEFFVHSPFAMRQNDCDVEDRNLDALVVQATFVVSGTETKALLTSDVNWEVLRDVVKTTRKMKNDQRLEWDIVNLPHHCSYTALGPKKGNDETAPVEEVIWLYETQGRAGAVIVSTSWPIPSDDADGQPPHRQAGAYYKRILKPKAGEFIVTMAHPKESAPEPLVIKIESGGAVVEKRIASGVTAIVSSPAPRAG